MNKEALIQKLKDEGFVHVYEWQDEPHTIYEEYAHNGAVTLYILNGNVTLNFEDGKVELYEGDRFDVPVVKKHSAVVGPNGCAYIVGEMIKGDSW